MRLRPRLGGVGVYIQRHGQIQRRERGFLHDAADDGDGVFGLILGAFEDEFVVDLEEHLGFVV